MKYERDTAVAELVLGVCVYACINLYLGVSACVRARMYLSIHPCRYASVCLAVRVYMRPCVCVCACACRCMCLCAYRACWRLDQPRKRFKRMTLMFSVLGLNADCSAHTQTNMWGFVARG